MCQGLVRKLEQAENRKAPGSIDKAGPHSYLSKQPSRLIFLEPWSQGQIFRATRIAALSARKCPESGS
jgi:hypothetical protein